MTRLFARALLAVFLGSAGFALAQQGDPRLAYAQAQQTLELAKEQKRLGEEPLPGERTGNRNHTSRLNQAYWERQADLQGQVDRAEASLKRAELNLRRSRD